MAYKKRTYCLTNLSLTFYNLKVNKILFKYKFYIWQIQKNMLLFNYKINELWISQLFKISRTCTRECTYFFILKIEQTVKSTLSTNCYCLSALTSLSSVVCLCCSNWCCNIMFFSFSAMYLLTKCRIKSPLVNFSPPFRL